MENILNKYIEEIKRDLEKKGFNFLEQRSISYGKKVIFSKDNYEIGINIYFSKKKGLSTVIQSKKDNPLLSELNQYFKKETVDSSDINFSHNWNLWVGTDESGKGDFFGPLVVAGFLCKKEFLPYLKQIGVKDSKLLKDKEIISLAEKILKYYKKYIKKIILMPIKYNALYEKFREQNKKLNEMMGWMHGRIISDLYKNFQPEGIIVDKFGAERTVKNSLKELHNIKIKMIEKAESDLAVATASIIARYYFLLQIEDMNNKYGMHFPKGASQIVIETGRDFIQKYSKTDLVNVAKLHFKTSEKLI